MIIIFFPAIEIDMETSVVPCKERRAAGRTAGKEMTGGQ